MILNEYSTRLGTARDFASAPGSYCRPQVSKRPALKMKNLGESRQTGIKKTLVSHTQYDMDGPWPA